jgi:hydroxypyruvate reductase
MSAIRDRMTLHKDALTIIDRAIKANLPQAAVLKALESHHFTGPLSLVAIGKAAWTMAKAASDFCREHDREIRRGIVITKYGHSQGALPGLEVVEAGHPVPDERTLFGTEKAIRIAEALGAGDELLFLISGGGSALFEKPAEGISLDEIAALNLQLLGSGADIVEVNTIRKRLSLVKGGRFARICAPARVFAVALSDVLGDRLDSIASGPAAPDMTTAEDAFRIAAKYGLSLTPSIRKALEIETPKTLTNVETVVTGSVRTLCESAAAAAKELGYAPLILCDDLTCEAREAGRFAAAIARRAVKNPPCAPRAFIIGGETVVHLRGGGKGGRNQELAFAAAEGIAGLDKTLIFSVGSDGTDGPTDAAGGVVDGRTMARLREKGIDFEKTLDENDAYHGLEAIDGLIKTGPTGTNVNDLTVILCGK